MTTATELNPVHETPTNTPIARTGTWFGRWGRQAYELNSGLDYTAALQVATHWATQGLTEPTVEVEVAVYPAGEEWVVDVVATERVHPFETLGSRRARIDSSGRLVA